MIDAVCALTVGGIDAFGPTRATSGREGNLDIYPAHTFKIDVAHGRFGWSVPWTSHASEQGGCHAAKLARQVASDNWPQFDSTEVDATR